MAMNVPGLIALVVFYLLILISGIIAGWKTNKKGQTKESILVADRSLTTFVNIFTITASAVGGAYINGCAEAAAAGGLLYSQAFIGYSLCFIPAGLFYAPKMRKENYLTMFDPFQLKYGKKVGGLLFVPHFFSDLFWSAATLAALGATISIILDLDPVISIIVSALVAMFYTFCGGLYSVAYTDIFQLIIIGLGLIIAFPFCLTHPAVSFSRRDQSIWGEVPKTDMGVYIDVWIQCCLGGIPFQALFQRILACKTSRIATVSTTLCCFMSLLLATPPVIMGLAGAAADWNQTTYKGAVPLGAEMYPFILPLSLNHLTPLPIGVIGIGALAAAVMSSADSCFLSASTVFAKNIYQDILRPHASQREVVWVLRISILVFGSLATVVAVSASSILGLFILCADLMYVVLLPQLTFILWWKASNAYGCISGYFVAFVSRILCGEPVIGLPAAVKLPWFDKMSQTQKFPYRSFCMVLGSVAFVLVTVLTNYVFLNDKVATKYDLLKCYRQRTKHIREKKLSNINDETGEANENKTMIGDSVEDDVL